MKTAFSEYFHNQTSDERSEAAGGRGNTCLVRKPKLKQVDIDRSKVLSTRVRKVVGTVCAEALSDHFRRQGAGSVATAPKSRRSLEMDSGAWTGRGRKGRLHTSNRTSGWRRGSLPCDVTIAQIEDLCGIDLSFWRDLPFWPLLNPEPPSLDLLYAIVHAQCPHLEGAVRGVSILLPAHPVQYLNLRESPSIGQLTTLIALARLAEIHADMPAKDLASLCVFDVLPDVLRLHPLPHAAIPMVFALFRDVLWSNVDLAGVLIDLDETVLQQALARAPDSASNKIRAADVYEVHMVLIARAKALGRSAHELEPDDDPSAANHAALWLRRTRICRFIRSSTSEAVVGSEPVLEPSGSLRAPERWLHLGYPAAPGAAPGIKSRRSAASMAGRRRLG